MVEFAVVLVLLVAMLVIASVTAFLVFVRSLNRRNRVSPRIPTIAPLTWLFLPERPARLHRRLRRAIEMARAAAALHTKVTGPGAMSIPDLVADLEHRACVIDSQLVVASRATGPARWSMLNELEQQVYEVDALSTRIVGLTSTWAAAAATSAANGPAGLSAINDRLDALESAIYEVGAIGSGNHPSFDPLPTRPAPHLRPVKGDRAD